MTGKIPIKAPLLTESPNSSGDRSHDDFADFAEEISIRIRRVRIMEADFMEARVNLNGHRK